MRAFTRRLALAGFGSVSLYDSNLELTLSDERDGYLGLITLDLTSA
jgi:hypothetical protein